MWEGTPGSEGGGAPAGQCRRYQGTGPELGRVRFSLQTAAQAAPRS